MKKYYYIFKSLIDEYAAYRLSFVLWRFRIVLRFILIFFLWDSIYGGKAIIFGYTQKEMLSYIILTAVVSTFILGTRTQEIAERILNGDIINYLLKPISLFKVYFTRDMADKFLNTIFSLFEISLFLFFFHTPLTTFSGGYSFVFFVLFIVLGVFMFFFINLILSFIAFWSTEIWAPRFIMQIIMFFLSGTYFPLDILPKPLYIALLATPFPYLYYLPVKIYLHGIDELFPFQLLMACVWTLAIYLAAQFMWQKGLKNYSFFGR